jgi:type IV pilus assembly protein PilM
MTPWNPLNVFTNVHRTTSDGLPSASFDPPRPGAPAGPNLPIPAIGVGDGGASVGRPAFVEESRRQPIGFAAPSDEGEPRFRTELSFKRHRDMPRASSTPAGPDDGAPVTWQTSDTTDFDSGAVSAVPGGEGGEPSSLDESDQKVPFYKREIGFRRKSSQADAGHEPAGLEDATADEPVEFVHESEHDAWSEGDALEIADDAEGFPADVPATKVPFYKREISLRRKSPDVLDDPVEPDTGAHEPPADQSDVPSPFAAADADEIHDDVFGDATADDAGAAAASADSWDSWEIGPVGGALVEEPDEDLVAVTAAASDTVSADTTTEDVSDSDDVPETDDLFVEDAPPTRRFSSRKDKGKDTGGEKAPKRKSTRGGGAKGRRVVGLKIGASQIAAAVVAEADGARELVELVRRPLAAGIVVDGEVKDVDALASALKAFFAEESLPRKDVRIGLASNRIGVRTFDIVGIDDEARFDNAVRFKAHEVLPVAAHESVLDYRVLEERPNEAGEPVRRVLLVVAPKDQVQPYVEVAERAGIKLAGIDLEALGLLRAFVDPKPYAVRAIDDTATVVVSIGHESSTLLVAGGGACEFTRVFDWGGAALIDAIANDLEVPPAEAATILKHLSLSGPGRQFAGLDEVDRARAVEAVRLRLTPFARELVNSLQFYQTQDESLGIGGIVITGGTSQLEGLGEALNQMIGVDVSVGDPLARVSVAAEIDPAIDASIGSMAVPIGLAIDDLAMRGVDLLPKDAKKKKSPRANLVAIGAPVAVAVPLVALGLLYLGAHGKTTDNQAELDAVRAEIAALPEPVGPEIDASIVGDEAARATAVARVLGGRVAWDTVLSDMSRILPANVWLASLSASAPEIVDPAGGAAAAVAASVPGQVAGIPTAVTLQGYTYSQPDVARLLARLATLPSLKRVTLTSSQKETLGTRNVVRFSIVADLSQTGGAS